MKYWLLAKDKKLIVLGLGVCVINKLQSILILYLEKQNKKIKCTCMVEN